MTETPPPLIWYRPSIRRAAWMSSARSIGLTVLGSFVLGALLVNNVDFGSPWLIAYLAGLVLITTGPLSLLLRLATLVGRERVLTIHSDGLRWQVGDAAPSHCAWSDVGEPRVEGRELVIVTAGDAWRVPLPLEGIEAIALVRLILELRQKALLGLPVRPRTPGS